MASHQLNCSLCDKELTGNIIRLNSNSCVSHWIHSQCLNGYPSAPSYICPGCNAPCSEIVKGCVVSTLVKGIWNGVPHQTPKGEVRFVESHPGMVMSGRNGVEGFAETFDDENVSTHVQHTPDESTTNVDGIAAMDESYGQPPTYRENGISRDESSGPDEDLDDESVTRNEFDAIEDERVDNGENGPLERDYNFRSHQRMESQFHRNGRVERNAFGLNEIEQIEREDDRLLGANERFGSAEFGFRGNRRMVRDNHGFGGDERSNVSEFRLRENEQLGRAYPELRRKDQVNRNEYSFRVNEQPRLDSFSDYQHMRRTDFRISENERMGRRAFGESERVIGDRFNYRGSYPVHRDDLGFQGNHQVEQTEEFRPRERTEFGFQYNKQGGPDAFGRYEQLGRTGFSENERVTSGDLGFRRSYPVQREDMVFQRHWEVGRQAGFRGMRRTNIGLRGTAEVGQAYPEFLRREGVERSEFEILRSEPMERTDSEFRRGQRTGGGEFSLPVYQRVGRGNFGFGGNDLEKSNHGRYNQTEAMESEYHRFCDDNSQEQSGSINGEVYIEAEGVTTRQQQISATMNEYGTRESPGEATHPTADSDEDHEVFAAIGSQGHAEAVARGVLTRKQRESGDHTCDTCRKKHSTKHKKYRCKQSHMPQKSFPCPVPGCSNAFTRPDNVATHIKKKHPL